MTISDNLETFNGKTIVDYSISEGIQDPDEAVYRLRLDYDDYDKGKSITELIESFCNDPKAALVQELVIGAFDYENSIDSGDIVETLVKYKDSLSNLIALFIGDITYEEMEISWIKQSNMGPVLEAYPNLELFQVRGGDGLSLGNLNHSKLKKLIVETGGLPTNVLVEVANAHLPQLEHLELWLGSEGYGFEASVEDLAPILSENKFPKLKYLGLRDSEIADDIAKALQQAPILKKLETLDLSLGALGDEGALALIESPYIKNLKFLDLHHHFMSDEIIEQVQSLGIKVDVSDQIEEEEDGYRYVAVSE
jgi:hypothetical protein